MTLKTDDLILRYGKENIENIATKADGALDLDLIAKRIEDGVQLVKSYVGGIFENPVFKNHILIIAFYFLEKERATDKARQDYEDTLKFLELVALGKIKIASSLNSPDATGSLSNLTQIKSEGRIFKSR